MLVTDWAGGTSAPLMFLSIGESSMVIPLLPSSALPFTSPSAGEMEGLNLSGKFKRRNWASAAQTLLTLSQHAHMHQALNFTYWLLYGEALIIQPCLRLVKQDCLVQYQESHPLADIFSNTNFISNKGVTLALSYLLNYFSIDTIY